MWNQTALTRKLGITYPIIQAPMAGASSHPDLVAAVSNSGGLGSYGGGYLSPEKIQAVIDDIRSLTDRPFNFNLFIPAPFEDSHEKKARVREIMRPYFQELGLKDVPNPTAYAPSFEEQMEAVIEKRVPVFSFTFGIPDNKWIKRLKEAGIVTMGTATHLDEGIELKQAGIDFVVAQGKEAGGHRGTFLGPEKEALIATADLTAQLTTHLTVPVIAAGGIMDERGIARALKSGVHGVQMGTAFLTAEECPIHPGYKELLLNQKADQTELTRAFSGRFARGIRNRFLEEMRAYENVIPDYPIQNAITAPLRKAAAEKNQLEFFSLWAGQSAALCQQKKAKDLIKGWVEKLNATF